MSISKQLKPEPNKLFHSKYTLKVRQED